MMAKCTFCEAELERAKFYLDREGHCKQPCKECERVRNEVDRYYGTIDKDYRRFLIGETVRNVRIYKEKHIGGY
jgi:hypothetical protein